MSILTAIFWFLAMMQSEIGAQTRLARGQEATANKPTTTDRRIPMQKGVIGPEGSTVYQRPDFDSPVISQLPPGMEVSISKKARVGVGGMGLFYVVRLSKTRIGYLVDTEVIPRFKAEPAEGGVVAAKANPDFEEAKRTVESSVAPKKSVYSSRFFGAGAGIVNYSEKFAGDVARTNESLMSLRMSGPGWLSPVLPVDWNLAFSLAAPKFYSQVAQAPATGFWVMSDFALMLPFMETDDSLLHYGFGAVLTYTQFSVPSQVSNFLDSRELRLGASFHAGFAARSGAWVLRVDGKYYFEVTRFFGAWMAIQREY